MPVRNRQMCFYYTSAMYALDDIIHGHIKVSLIPKLNDPNEWLPDAAVVDSKTHNYQSIPLDNVKSVFEKGLFTTHGIISFSRSETNLSLWGKYADSYRGAVLGFDICEDRITDVIYNNCRVELNRSSLDELRDFSYNDFNRLVNVKACEWQHENEVRMIVPILTQDCKKENTLFFLPFGFSLNSGDDIVLKTVICGPRMDVEHIAAIRHELSIESKLNVELGFADLQQSSFRLRIQKDCAS